MDEVINFISGDGRMRKRGFPYDTDGVVIKVNSLEAQQLLGSTAKVAALGNGIQVRCRTGGH
ncbi:MAG: hypothetical protein U5L72_19860 [Bacteroidales bacterium]|nr:hypothetical protein [Bacteroidales bacterium]